MSARYLVGDALSVMRTLPAGSVDLVLSSPPYLSLRSYLPADHPDKAREMGSEPTPGEFLDGLLDVVEECRRVLAPHGSVCIELGDTFAGSGGAGGDYNANGLRDGQARFDGSASKAYGTGAAPRPARSGRRNRPVDEAAGILAPRSRPGPEGRDSVAGWPLDKSLCMVPELLRFAMVYGFSPLTGRETERWRVRNVVRHFRPNPPVGALGDKWRPATSDWVVACVGRKRYFDLDSGRGPASANSHARTAKGVESRPTTGKPADDHRRGGNFSTLATVHETNGAPPLDWFVEDDLQWKDAAGFVASTFGYPGAHFATFSPKAIKRFIEAMCPARVCRECGLPSERIVEIEHEPNRTTNGPQSIDRTHLDGGSAGYAVRADRFVSTVGWTDCGHNAWRPGVVLDPFAGSGTTGEVATGCGRDAVLVDLDERNAHLARERIGMLLEVEAPAEAAS